MSYFSYTQIFVKTISGKTITLDIEPNFSILDIKKKIYDQCGIPPETQILKYCGKILDSSYSIKRYKIEQDAIIDVSVRLSSSTLATNKQEKQPHGAKFIKFSVSNNGKILHESTLKTLSESDKTKPINSLIENYLRETNLNRLFYSGYCPFKGIKIIFNGKHINLNLSKDPYSMSTIKTFSGSVPICDDEFGLIPLDPLTAIFGKKDNDKNDDIKKKLLNRYNNDNDKDAERRKILSINIKLSEISFLFHNKLYYINGQFYPYNSKKKDIIKMQFYPLLREPQKITENSLISGYIRNNVDRKNKMIPLDIINLINVLFPRLCGGHYNVIKYNPKINDELEQKTKIFTICGMNFFLKYFGDDALFLAKGLYLILDGNCKETDICIVTFLCQLYCKSTKQSVSIIETQEFTNNNMKETIPLTDFGDTSRLEMIDCNIQILSMIESNKIYQYPLQLKQNGYLLEWIVNGDELLKLQKCMLTSTQTTIESDIFYDMFLLRCGITDKSECSLSIQLIALPQNIGQLKTKCEIFTVETHHHVSQFDATFDYNDDNQCYGYYLSKMKDTITFQKKLTFRVEIEIEDEIENPKIKEAKIMLEKTGNTGIFLD